MIAQLKSTSAKAVVDGTILISLIQHWSKLAAYDVTGQGGVSEDVLNLSDHESIMFSIFHNDCLK